MKRRHGPQHIGGADILVCLLSFLFCLLSLPLQAADKKDEPKKDQPKITCLSATALLPTGQKNLKIRGQFLTETTAATVTLNGQPLPATIKSKGKAEPPKPYDAARIGDTHVEIEFKLPPDTKPGELTLTLTTPTGTTAPQTIRIANPKDTAEEKEPNNGFKTAQLLPFDQTILGAIQEPSDVDVFKIVGKAGMKIAAEVTADRKGSILDASLTLYDAGGHILATADDSENSRDPILKTTLLSDGLYYLSLTDANDRGTPVHTYELILRHEK